MRGWRRKNYTQGCVESSTLCLGAREGVRAESSAWAGWHRVQQREMLCQPPNKWLSLSEVWVFVYVRLSFSLFLLNDAVVIHQFPACPCLSVWHERTNLTSCVSLNTSNWLSLTLVVLFRLLDCFYPSCHIVWGTHLLNFDLTLKYVSVSASSLSGVMQRWASSIETQFQWNSQLYSESETTKKQRRKGSVGVPV